MALSHLRPCQSAGKCHNTQIHMHHSCCIVMFPINVHHRALWLIIHTHTNTQCNASTFPLIRPCKSQYIRLLHSSMLYYRYYFVGVIIMDLFFLLYLHKCSEVALTLCHNYFCHNDFC